MEQVAQFFKILADESRIQILWLLFNHKELCVCDIMEALNITQSKASRHLATLKNAGLVQDRKEAAWSYYSISPIEDELKKQIFEVLKESLKNQNTSTDILQKLDEWLIEKQPGTCKKSS